MHMPCPEGRRQSVGAEGRSQGIGIRNSAHTNQLACAPHAGTGDAGPAPYPPPLSPRTSVLYCMLALPMQVRPPPLLPHFHAHLLCCMLALAIPALPAPLSPTLPSSLAVLYVGAGDVDALPVPVGVQDVLPSGSPVLHRVVLVLRPAYAPVCVCANVHGRVG